MPRRRYRLFAVTAVVMLFMLYRVMQNSWIDSAGTSSSQRVPLSPAPPPPPVPDTKPVEAYPPPADTEKTEEPPVEQSKPLGPPPPPAAKPPPPVPPKSEEDKAFIGGDRVPFEDAASQGKPSLEKPVIPDLKPEVPAKDDSSILPPPVKAPGTPPQAPPANIDGDNAAASLPAGKRPGEVAESLQWQNPPNGKDHKDTNHKEGPVQIHWQKTPENFPVAPESIIPVPTGKPKSMPKVQYAFKPESDAVKVERLDRLDRVKKEMERTWSGYKKYAWMHDEIKPVSGKFRDPFCGWAATLVDSLDTLWIMGFKDEFDEAAKATKDIDFTFALRDSIPVFETVIRYLGGLVAAFDISGGHEGDYPILLQKAVELAEILMGIFDTPNRMPMLYYRWKPDFASQPHLATKGGLAELGTLSMEFTRLAQLTGVDKYYDAVDRITNAMIELQEAGRTDIPGLFPEEMDISGCERVVRPSGGSTLAGADSTLSKSRLGTSTPSGSGAASGSKSDLTAGSGAVSKVAQDQIDAARNLPEPEGYIPSKKPITAPEKDSSLLRRDTTFSGGPPPEMGTPRTGTSAGGIVPGGQQTAKRPPPAAAGANGNDVMSDCEPQGIMPMKYRTPTYHMAGGTDSAYEYFAKQYLLLGGLEPKYQRLYEDTVDATNEWLLYRPMIKEKDWDILFTARVTAAGTPKQWLKQFEVTHLTCFIGGMYGLGGKIFGRPADVETAKRLTDGCVWSYQSTLSGIMPESAHLLACDTLERCEFNETLWWEVRDPYDAYEHSDAPPGVYAEESRQTGATPFKPPIKAAGSTTSSKADSLGLRKRAVLPKVDSENVQVAGAEADSVLPDSLKEKLGWQSEETTKGDASDGLVMGSSKSPVAGTSGSSGSTGSLGTSGSSGSIGSIGSTGSKDTSDSLRVDMWATGNGATGTTAQKGNTNSGASGSTLQNGGSTSGTTGSTLQNDGLNIDGSTFSPDGRRPTKTTQWQDDPLDEHQKQLDDDDTGLPIYKPYLQKLPPPYTDIRGKSYILRPEAIESVWYMYRITGDRTWQDKGWKMFQAVVRATRAEFGNSAINSVLVSEPTLHDEMESFWTAETLKYFYLLFAEPDVVSLDEWVLNTEAHPFRRPS